jgi:hypothetical protein
MESTNIKVLHDFRASWRQMLRLGLLALAALNPPAFLLAQNPARGVKFERIGLEQGARKARCFASCKTGRDLYGLI